MGQRLLGARPKKRLIEAAVYWAREHLDDFTDYTDAIEKYRALNMPPELIAEYEAMQAEENADFDVDPDEVETVAMFQRLSNHWRIDIGMSGGLYLGCDIGLAIKLLEHRREKNIDAVVDELLLMEAAAKAKLNEILQRRRDEQRQRV
ncbi:MAG: DUF1799 domain-containing protein [Burkholderiales bacterium]|nr:DUF1799 domain-containing protein [Burkholderiales bacterium]